MNKGLPKGNIDTVTLGSLDEGLQWVGRVAEPFPAPDKIEFGAVRHFCELIEDPNPMYFDAAAASMSIWRGPIAPPGSLQIWSMPLTWSAPGTIQNEPPRLQRRVPLPGDRVLAVGVETEFLLPLRIGDRLRYVEKIDSITPKTTRLGEGAIVKISQTYGGEDHRVRAIHRISAFRYSTSGSPHGSTPGTHPGNEWAGDFGFDYPVTLERCVLAVSATRDYNPFHYDREFARSGGAADVFLNVMTYQGLFGRLLSEWGGAEAMLRKLAFRMVGMNIPGDMAHVQGTLDSDAIVDGRRQAEVSIRIYNDRVGLTAEGKATLRWPSAEEVAN